MLRKWYITVRGVGERGLDDLNTFIGILDINILQPKDLLYSYKRCISTEFLWNMIASVRIQIPSFVEFVWAG